MTCGQTFSREYLDESWVAASRPAGLRRTE